VVRLVLIIGSGRHTQRLIATGLNLAVSPPRNLDNVAHDAVVALFRIQRNVVPEGDRLAVFLEPHTPVLELSTSVQLQRDDLLTRVLRAPTSLRVRES
jgi:hypothetical protein